MNNDQKFTKADFKHIDFDRDPKLAALFGFGDSVKREGRAGGSDGSDEPATLEHVEFNIGVGKDHVAPRDKRQRLAAILKATANVERINILELLAEGELSPAAIEDQTAISQSSVSRHLNTLCRAGLVEKRIEGRAHFYRLTHPELPEKLAAVARTVLK